MLVCEVSGLPIPIAMDNIASPGAGVLGTEIHHAGRWGAPRVVEQIVGPVIAQMPDGTFVKRAAPSPSPGATPQQGLFAMGSGVSIQV